MSDEADATAASGEVDAPNPVEAAPWFSGRDRTHVLLLRVNRRPLSTLFGTQPDDVLDHIVEALLFGETVETGRSNKRQWRLGNRDVDVENRTLTGRLGYVRSSVQYRDHFDEEFQRWIENVEQADVTAQAPFAFDAENRYLAVLQHPSFNASQVATVFRTILNRGENARGISASTDWDVEPLLDEADFLRWLRTADSVLSVTFTAKLPNPDGSEELDPVWTRLHERKARLLQERMEAFDEQAGLSGIENDPVAKSYIAMATRAFGWIKGKRRVNGEIEVFNQRQNTRTHDLRNLPATFAGALSAMVEYLQSERNK